MNIGTFEITSGTIIITDPCYQVNDVTTNNINALNGTWNAEIYYDDSNSYVKQITAFHTDYNNGLLLNETTDEVFVDSGQAGIYDQSYYQNDSIVNDLKSLWKNIANKEPICEDEPWYSLNCAHTLSKAQAGVIPFGVVTSSGFGDGSYQVTISKNNKDQAVLISIIFDHS